MAARESPPAPKNPPSVFGGGGGVPTATGGSAFNPSGLGATLGLGGFDREATDVEIEDAAAAAAVTRR